MIEREKVIENLNCLLSIDKFNDLCPNGIQIEGKKYIKKIATSVTASLKLFKIAYQKKCDLILVHHGLLFNNDSRVIKGVYRKRLKFLLKHNMNLASYHLPLDAHPTIGNNILIAKLLHLVSIETFGFYKNIAIGYLGFLKKEKNLKSIIDYFDKKIFLKEKKRFIYFPFGKRYIKKIAIVSGSGSSFLEEAIEKNCDLFISGEAKESTMHLAKEAKINFLALGHYNSEILGIRALGRYIQKKFNIEHEFIKLKNYL